MKQEKQDWLLETNKYLQHRAAKVLMHFKNPVDYTACRHAALLNSNREVNMSFVELINIDM